MILDPIPQSFPVHFFGSRPQPPTSLSDIFTDLVQQRIMCQKNYEWVMSHIWMSHMNTSHLLRRDTSQDRAKWQNFTCDSCLTYVMLWHDSNMCAARHDLFIYWDKIYSYIGMVRHRMARHDSFIHINGETWLIHTYKWRDMTHSYI